MVRIMRIPLFIMEYIRIIFRGISHILGEAFRFLLAFLKHWTIAEKALLFALFVCTIFLFQPWMSFEAILSETRTVRHVIYSNDMFLLFLCFFAVGFSLLWSTLTPEPKTVDKVWIAILRLAGTGLPILIWIVNFFDPSRITHAEGASFTWQFYLFFVSCLSLLLIGLASLRAPQNHRLKMESFL